MKRFKDILFALTHPSFWLSNYESHEYWDAKVNQLIDRNEKVMMSPHGHEAIIGGYTIWISNYPFCFGYNRKALEILPYRRTRKRLRDYIIKELVEVKP